MTKNEMYCRRVHPDAYIESSPVANSRKRHYVIKEPTGGGGCGTLASGSSIANAWKALKKGILDVSASAKVEDPESKSLERIFAGMSDHTHIDYVREDCIIFKWSEKGRGFGEYAFVKSKEGKWSIDNECDGREEVKQVLCRLVDSLPLRDAIPGDPNSGNVS
jgi:hypothetical protein